VTFTTTQAKEIKGPARIVTVLPDSGVKYLSKL
jgi:cysteine synthase